MIRSPLTPAQRVELLRQLLEVLNEAISSSGAHGVAGGTLYAVLLSYGCDLQTYEMLMRILVKSGRVRQIGNHFYAVKKAA